MILHSRREGKQKYLILKEMSGKAQSHQVEAVVQAQDLHVAQTEDLSDRDNTTENKPSVFISL